MTKTLFLVNTFVALASAATWASSKDWAALVFFVVNGVAAAWMLAELIEERQ